MKAIVRIAAPRLTQGPLGSCASPLWPVMGRPLFAWVADRLRNVGVSDVLFLGNGELVEIEGQFGDGDSLGLRIRFLNSTRCDPLATIEQFCADEPVVMLPGETYVGEDDLPNALAKLGGGAHAIRGVHRTRFRAYQEEIHDASSECRRMYDGYGIRSLSSDAADFYIVRPESSSADGGNGKKGPSEDWVEIPTSGMRIRSDQQYFELNRAMLVRSVGNRPSSARKATPVNRAAHVGANVSMRGPVLLCNGAIIEEGASLLGPCIIGPLAVVGRGATVIESILWPGAEIAENARIVHSVVTREEVTRVRRNPVLAASPDVVAGGSTAASSRPLRVSRIPTGRLSFWGVKRAVDFVASGVGLVALSPLLLITAAAIKLTSRGPVFFRHRRQGFGGKEFDCVKFRSMRHGADATQAELRAENQEDGPQFKPTIRASRVWGGSFGPRTSMRSRSSGTS